MIKRMRGRGSTVGKEIQERRKERACVEKDTGTAEGHGLLGRGCRAGGGEGTVWNGMSRVISLVVCHGFSPLSCVMGSIHSPLCPVFCPFCVM